MKKYEDLEMEVIELDTEDVITTSGGDETQDNNIPTEDMPIT